MTGWRGDSYRTDLYAGVASNATQSNVAWVGDAEFITVITRGSPSTTTIELSNASGGHDFETGSVTIPENSWAEDVNGTGETVLQPKAGARWLRCIRSETTAAMLAWKRD